MRRLITCAFAAGLLACSSVEPLDLADGCQPLLAGHDCLLPYPSDFFLVDDPALPSGKRVQISGAARMRTEDGAEATVQDSLQSDGFSRIPPIAWAFDRQVDVSELVRLRDDPKASATVANRTLLIHGATGALIPHYVDVDAEAEDPSRQAIMMYPLERLDPEQRYVVAVKGLSGITAPEGFRRLRDDVGDRSLEGLLERYEREVFSVLTNAGVNRSELQLAWSFTTQSADHPKQDLLRVRELTRRWLETNTPTVSITKVSQLDDDDNWRTIEGMVTGPMFLLDDEPGSTLVKGPDGQVRQNGLVQFRFIAKVPGSVRDAADGSLALGYGHGIFGDRRELNTGSVQRMSNALQAVVFSVDWWGLSMSDVLLVVENLLTRPGELLSLTDRVLQAMANWMVMIDAIRGPLRLQPALQSEAGAPLYEPDAVGFIGLSVGHILAGTLLALDTDVKRWVLNVGGAGFTHMMPRARPFGPFLTLMKTSVPDPMDRQKFIVTLQEGFDRVDPATYAEHVLDDPLDGAPTDRQVLLQIGLGDTQVPNLASNLHARHLGVPLLTPAPASIFGVEEISAPHRGSAIALYDFGIDLSVYDAATTKVDENPVHDRLRTLSSAQRQMRTFFSEGQIINPCDGVCDPE